MASPGHSVFLFPVLGGILALRLFANFFPVFHRTTKILENVGDEEEWKRVALGFVVNYLAKIFPDAA